MNHVFFALFCVAQLYALYLLWSMRQEMREIDAYRLSRARAAATHYRTALVLYAQGKGSEVDPDEMAAFAAALDMDDLTADELRAETLDQEPDRAGNRGTETT